MPAFLFLLTLPLLVRATSPIGASAETFCGVISKELPSKCNCTDLILGGRVDCKMLKVLNDTIGLRLDVAPCAKVAHVDLEVTESKYGKSLTLEGIEAGQSKDVPIPSVSMDVPEVGNIGIDVAVKVDGNLDNLRLSVGVDACGEVLGHKVCASKVIPYLPIWILKGNYSFGKMCKKGRLMASTIVV